MMHIDVSAAVRGAIVRSAAICMVMVMRNTKIVSVDVKLVCVTVHSRMVFSQSLSRLLRKWNGLVFC